MEVFLDMNMKILTGAALTLGFAAATATAIPNPAAVGCTTLGGTIEILEGPQGQSGFCRFMDGSLIEEWTLRQATFHQKPTDATKAFLMSSMLQGRNVHPQFYCRSVGGVPGFLMKGDSPVQVCRFQDKTLIASETLLRGPVYHPILTQILKAK